MKNIDKIISEEIMTTTANHPQFGERLNSINELGEGNANAYPFEVDNFSDSEINYYFDTDEEEMIVTFTLVDMYKIHWEMQFGSAGGTPDQILNDGNMFKSMATITQITNDFIEKIKPNILRFKPTKEDESDNRRFNLYMAFIKKHMIPAYFVFEYGEYIVIERKIKINTNIPRI